MTLTVPAYLVASGVRTSTLRFEWDESKLGNIEEPYDEAFIATLATRFSQRGIIATMLGCAEWLVYRFMALNADPAPWDYLEAAWAMTVHHRYSNYGSGTGWIEHTQSDADHWTGPAKGPTARALIIVQSTIQELAWHRHSPADYSRYIARSAATVHKLVLHVIEQPEPYRMWLSCVLDRLEKGCPLVMGDELGDVVPRAALDPLVPFDASLVEAAMDEFLGSLVPACNPFLSDVPGMMQHIEDDTEPDFPGTPYRFSIALDRVLRKVASV